MNETLKPCPFCGGVAEYVEREYKTYLNKWTFKKFLVRCTQCRVMTDSISGAENDYDTCRIKVRDLWNRRVQDDPK